MSDEEMIPLSPERILAAILRAVPEVEVPLEILLGDFTEYQIDVSQRNDDALVFRLVRNDLITDVEYEDAVSPE